MKQKSKKAGSTSLNRAFSHISTKVTKAVGRPISFIIAFVVIIIWAVSGPVFHYSDTWQLVINTGTTIITFLMVFIIQQSQNKDTTAVQLKLNELIACNEKASNRLVDIEDLTEEEMAVLKKFYIKLSKLAENDLYGTHSVDEAEEIHQEKKTQIKATARRTNKK